VTDDGSTMLRRGVDVAVVLPDKSFPGRIFRILHNGKEIDEIEWVGAGEGHDLVLTDGTVISTGVVVPGDNCCHSCHERLKQGPVGVFTCDCEGWRSDQWMVTTPPPHSTFLAVLISPSLSRICRLPSELRTQ